MPLRQCQSTSDGALFRGEKLGDRIISGAEQKVIFEQFQKAPPEDPRISLFCSTPTDEDALEAACLLLRRYVAGNWADFEFVNSEDVPPRDPELVKSLYVLMGINHQDPCAWIRRWVRSRLGVPLWICMTAPKPIDWYQDQLGIRPDFLFSVKGSAVSAG